MLFAQRLIEAKDAKSNSSTTSCPRFSPFTSATISVTACSAFLTSLQATITLAPAILVFINQFDNLYKRGFIEV